MKPFLLRAEDGGGGYLLSRVTGQAEPIHKELLAQYRRRDDVDFVPLIRPYPNRARAAPFTIWFELTRQCNLRCHYCGAPVKDQPSRLSMDQIRSVLTQFANRGVFEVRFTGGEPTLHPHFPEIAQTAADQGLFVSVNSNGVWSREQQNRYASLPVGLYVLSLDGPRRINNALRPPNSFDSVVASIAAMIRAGKRVRVNTVLCRKNKGCLTDFVPQLVKLGVEGLTLVPLRPTGRAVDRTFDSMGLSKKEYGDILSEVRNLRTAFPQFEIAASYDVMSQGAIHNTPPHFTKRCIAGVEAACLGSEGNLRGCILLDENEDIVGSLFETPFAELWANDDLWGIWRDCDRISPACRECTFFGDQCGGDCVVFNRYDETRGLSRPTVEHYCQLRS